MEEKGLKSSLSILLTLQHLKDDSRQIVNGENFTYENEFLLCISVSRKLMDNLNLVKNSWIKVKYSRIDLVKFEENSL